MADDLTVDRIALLQIAKACRSLGGDTAPLMGQTVSPELQDAAAGLRGFGMAAQLQQVHTGWVTDFEKLSTFLSGRLAKAFEETADLAKNREKILGSTFEFPAR